METNREERFERLRAGDVMIPLEQYPSALPSDTLRHAIAVMERAEIAVANRRSLPRILLVLDEGGTLVGTVRRRDIMRGLEPPFLGAQPLEYRKKLFDVTSDPGLLELSYRRAVAGVRKQSDRRIQEVMRPIETVVDHRDTLIKVIYALVNGRRSLLPVMAQQRVIGVVRSVEVFHELALIVGEQGR